MLHHSKASGPVQNETLMVLNGLINNASRLFRRHPDLPRFFHVSIDVPMSRADLAVMIARLTAASIHFEERYARLLDNDDTPGRG